MSSATVTVDSTAYVLLTASDALVQNISANPIRVAFANTLPLPATTDYHTLTSGQGILKSAGLPSGNIYVRADREDEDSVVTYSV